MSRLMAYRQLVGNWRFMSLCSGSFLSTIGDAVITISLVWMIYQQTGSAFLLSLTLICLEFPKFIVSPILGVFLDRYPPIVFTLISNGISGCLFLFLAFVNLESGLSYMWFMLLIVLSSALSPVTKAATTMIITETVDREKLIPANSLMNIQFDMALTLGPVVGGIIMATGHMEAAYVLNAMSFFIAGILYYFAMPPHARYRRNEAVVEAAVASRFKNWRVDLTNGIRYIWKSRVIRAVIIANALWNFFIWGSSSVLLPIFSDHRLASGADGYGVLMATLSIGIVVGSFVTGAVKIGKNAIKKLVFLSIAAHGLAYALLSISDGIVTAVAILILSGIVSAPAMIYIRSLMQVSIPIELMGRVFTVSSAFVALGYPVGTTLAASAVSTIGMVNVGWLFAIFGGLTVGITLFLSVTANEKFEKTQLSTILKKNRSGRYGGLIPEALVERFSLAVSEGNNQVQATENLSVER